MQLSIVSHYECAVQHCKMCSLYNIQIQCTRTFLQFVNIQAIIFTLASVVWEYVCIYSPVIRCMSVFIFIKCNKFMEKKHKHSEEVNSTHTFNLKIFGCYIIVGLLYRSLAMMDLSSVYEKSSI